MLLDRHGPDVRRLPSLVKSKQLLSLVEAKELLGLVGPTEFFSLVELQGSLNLLYLSKLIRLPPAS